MSKKIYDIKPPKIAKKVEKELKEFLGEKKNHSAKITAVKKQGRHKKENRPIWIPASIVGAAILLLVCVFLFFKLPKATIQIWPKVDVLSFQQKITADKSAGSIDNTQAVMPAKYFEVIKNASQDFPATGNASNEGLASGTITIYNKYDPPSLLTLKAGTHFMSDSGKLFTVAQKVVIPAAKKAGNKITSGSIQVKITAVEGGESYNIAPSAFIVPGLKGTAYYYSISAASTKAMSGGYAGKVKKITDDDIQGAKDALVKKTTDDAVLALKDQIPADYILLDSAISSNVASAGTQTKSGTVADKFNYQATVKASALAFKKSDLDLFAKDYIVSQMPEGKTLLDNTLKVNYSASLVDVSAGKITLNLDLAGNIYNNIDKNSLSLSLLGENAGQINQAISNSLGENVSKVKIKFWPFWVSSTPANQSRVNVELKFE
ncbi:MAG: hypothetical protein A2528_00305 [Candidatus Staskawiczbacteria bacterium RIFOXYD2_FULL_37_9]|uniref:GlxA-like beta barrel domain-containing protein n=1 Tax=Candidatus Staskawiczbacteria bacterium RIFOXYB1_FULL_37_44 TaxID=1802223 RepID=A0A1G2IW88_9BACT|nr:MAG: hypothetical protein A2358_01150 [Candidatus Staskawiczbacteria bacterium RIFOXYB1_FULL_37_44]OGZ84248.1 MAG: hypothetical protein A2416_02800 [Candidatus Staskawiczbacteria bacterium RIFOXYC1_FULL_37_52]OGZ89741.1 MAG: hypothetical protein A2581_01140 [Candidatus Staskawiczbacteria bacterium RIFOXYD1_FULL_37_110]OGZ92766.1 MAG: hypothetical protein A2528_00305 [Candidatus Staskawiczbacteria bacterium RIFOXYD2_FULL_37_9]